MINIYFFLSLSILLLIIIMQIVITPNPIIKLPKLLLIPQPNPYSGELEIILIRNPKKIIIIENLINIFEIIFILSISIVIYPYNFPLKDSMDK